MPDLEILRCRRRRPPVGDGAVVRPHLALAQTVDEPPAAAAAGPAGAGDVVHALVTALSLGGDPGEAAAGGMERLP